ncbi:MAG: carboxypeptidase-like regulatory domain-containing protein [Candidatus Marinimicrobia bacterium]|nr:carboxypeptidase-like regulatory domain-containing protein [Candidatus Neomarinimicrobiota bacterium]
MRKILIIMICLIMLSSVLMASTHGKITGRIVNAETDEPLIGANVIIQGTGLGSFTDENGYYVILNVPPATYNVVSSMVGYTRMVVEGVYVRIDLTTRVNMTLTEEVIGLDEVVVTAEKEIIKVDVASSQTDISSDQIKSLPVQSLSDVIGMEAGIDKNFNIRGSSAYEAAFNVDGMSMNDERSNVPYTTVSINAVQVVNIQIGGFNAEYENARSGVINVVTKEGDKEKYDAGITLRYAAPNKKYFGPVITAEEAYFARPYNDDDVAWWGTDPEDYTDINENGQWDMGEPFVDNNADGQYTDSPWDTYKLSENNSWEGFNNYALGQLQDNNNDNDLTAAAWQRVYQYQRRRSANIVSPDYTIDVGVGGPVPFIGKALGNLRFFASYRGEQEALAVPLARDTYNDDKLTLKLTSDINDKIKLNISAMHSKVQSVSRASWTSLPTGDDYFRSVYGVTNIVSTDYYLYMDATFCPTEITRNSIGLRWSHQLNNHSFYEVYLQHFSSLYYTNRLDPRDTTLVEEVVSGYWLDEQPFGYWYTLDGDGIGGYDDVVGMRTDWGGFAKDRSNNYSTIAKADYKNQLNENNEFKTGMKFVYTQYKINSWNDHPTNMFWSYYNEWYQNPWRLGAYAQDKLEFEGMVVNLGLRFDMSQANTDWYVFEDYDDLLTSLNGPYIDSLATTQRTNPIMALSPRFAISHPISERAKIYFNYGHFNALAQSRYRFVIDRLGTGQINRLGDPEIDYCRTVQYELGYEHRLMDDYLLKLKGYYKDITDQPAWTYYTNLDHKVSYSVADARNYKDVRGFEAELKKSYGDFFLFNMNFTYQVVSYGYYGNTRYYENPTEQMEYDRDHHISTHYQTRSLPIPLFESYFLLKTPSDYSLFGFNPKITGDWACNFMFKWEAGSITTYSQTNDPYVRDNVRWKDYYMTDLKISKKINIKPVSVSLFLDINNVLNTKRLSYAGFSDIYDRYDYLNSLHFSDEDGIEQGSDKIGDVRREEVDYTPIISINNLSTYPKVGNELALYYDNTTEAYFTWDGNAYVSAEQAYVDQVHKDKAYINMPDIESFTFLNPRKITFGITLNF